MTSSWTKRKPVLLGLAASFLLTVLIVAGSRNLEHYDSALFGYTIASIVAFGAIVSLCHLVTASRYSSVLAPRMETVPAKRRIRAEQYEGSENSRH